MRVERGGIPLSRGFININMYFAKSRAGILYMFFRYFLWQKKVWTSVCNVKLDLLLRWKKFYQLLICTRDFSHQQILIEPVMLISICRAKSPTHYVSSDAFNVILVLALMFVFNIHWTVCFQHSCLFLKHVRASIISLKIQFSVNDTWNHFLSTRKHTSTCHSDRISRSAFSKRD